MKNPPAKQETQDIWVQSLGQEDPLQKGMATHSRILTWEIPWTEKPRGLQSMESVRVGHDWATEHIHYIELHLIPLLKEWSALDSPRPWNFPWPQNFSLYPQWSHTLSRHGIQLGHKDSDLTSQELQKEFQPFTKLPPPCLHQMPARHDVIWLKSRDILVMTLLKTRINKQDTTENSLPSFQTRRAILLFQRATLLIIQTLS